MLIFDLNRRLLALPDDDDTGDEDIDLTVFAADA
jgi:hypothetical protein